MVRNKIVESKRKNNIYPAVRVDSETHQLVQKALEKLNNTLEISLTTFQRLALKSFANKIVYSEDIGIVFK